MAWAAFSLLERPSATNPNGCIYHRLPKRLPAVWTCLPPETLLDLRRVQCSQDVQESSPLAGRGLGLKNPSIYRSSRKRKVFRKNTTQNRKEVYLVSRSTNKTSSLGPLPFKVSQKDQQAKDKNPKRMSTSFLPERRKKLKKSLPRLLSLNKGLRTSKPK